MAYLMAGRDSELARLQLQSRVWEPAGSRLLAELGDGTGRDVLDVGCGALGWLRVLADWVGPEGSVTGTDLEPAMLASARTLLGEDHPARLLEDDLFDSGLPEASFDLVHARFQLSPLGRFDDQLDAYLRLVRPGGLLVLEDPDTSSWGVHPTGVATRELVDLVLRAFRAAGGDFDAGLLGRDLLRGRGLRPQVRAAVVALEPGHPYLRLPLQFATSLRPRLLSLLGETELDALLERVAAEVDDPEAWGTTFLLLQSWATVG